MPLRAFVLFGPPWPGAHQAQDMATSFNALAGICAFWTDGFPVARRAEGDLF